MEIDRGDAHDPRGIPFEEALGLAEVSRLQRSARRKAYIASALIVAMALISVCLVAVPLGMQAFHSADQAAVSHATERQADSWGDDRTRHQMNAARRYNRDLAASGQIALSGADDPLLSPVTGTDADTATDADHRRYESLLNVHKGIMGSVRIPKISVELPIYHGTSATVLGSGAGHLYGTSLPVGGKGTHSVLTAHRGLPHAAMFTRLDEMRKGDVFSVTVLDNTLYYRVDRIEVIEPDETDRLVVVPGQDRITLMTCTPYGVNTHRLLVSGTRYFPKSLPLDQRVDARLAAVLTGVTVAVIGSIVTVATRRRNVICAHSSAA